MNGDLSMKDSIGPAAIGFGTGLQLTPAQFIGILIAIWGAWYTRKRWLESKRANDIAQDRLNWEKQKHANATNAQTETKAEQD